MKTFEQASYLSQVRRLRQLGKAALTRYTIRAQSIHFINHGENTTFRITAINKKQFLLRIHRDDYHTKPAIKEELSWLAHLAKDGTLLLPKPVRSKHGNLIERLATAGVPAGRFCCVFEWVDGRFFGKSPTLAQLRALGQVIGKIQARTPASGVTHRRYWHADGLLGLNAKFGSIESLAGVSPKNQKTISKARRLVWNKLRRFEKEFPRRLGLIHADLHFGNVLGAGENIGVIDFDDCGFGFHAYDLAVSLSSVENALGPKNMEKFPKFKAALLSGYTHEARWDADDEMILPYLMTARKLVMLGWLNSRSDNPRLKKRLAGAVKRALQHLNTI